MNVYSLFINLVFTFNISSLVHSDIFVSCRAKLNWMWTFILINDFSQVARWLFHHGNAEVSKATHKQDLTDLQTCLNHQKNAFSHAWRGLRHGSGAIMESPEIFPAYLIQNVLLHWDYWEHWDHKIISACVIRMQYSLQLLLFKRNC